MIMRYELYPSDRIPDMSIGEYVDGFCRTLENEDIISISEYQHSSYNGYSNSVKYELRIIIYTKVRK